MIHYCIVLYVAEFTDLEVQATTISSGHLLLTALDHRAATYEKLDQLQDALRDAKAMIDLKPDLAKVIVKTPHHRHKGRLSNRIGLSPMRKGLAN